MGTEQDGFVRRVAQDYERYSPGHPDGQTVRRWVKDADDSELVPGLVMVNWTEDRKDALRIFKPSDATALRRALRRQNFTGVVVVRSRIKATTRERVENDGGEDPFVDVEGEEPASIDFADDEGSG